MSHISNKFHASEKSMKFNRVYVNGIWIYETFIRLLVKELRVDQNFILVSNSIHFSPIALDMPNINVASCQYRPWSTFE